MLKQIILKQKAELEHLLSLPYIERAKLKEAKKWMKLDLIKVIIGPRRAGKSVFSLMLLKDCPFAYFNFDDENLQNLIRHDRDEILRELFAVYGETKYLFFDEIQNLPKWELWINRLHREGYNLVLTGSNAKLLSKELATTLTGRHIPIEIFPFNFREYLRAKNYQFNAEKLVLPQAAGEFMRLLENYLVNGGYPEVVVKDIDSKGYLEVLFDSLLFKDVVKRHRVRFPQQIDDLGSYLINNVAAEYSFRKLANILRFKSGVTLGKYLDYLVEAYMIFFLNRYSHKAGERITAPKKAYVVDNGFIGAKAAQFSPDHGKLMKNLVLMELVKRGREPNREIFYYKTRNNREVDFILKKGNVIDEMIQVTYQIDAADAKQREIKALLEAKEELRARKLTIITWDNVPLESHDAEICFVSLGQWLLDGG